MKLKKIALTKEMATGKTAMGSSERGNLRLEGDYLSRSSKITLGTQLVYIFPLTALISKKLDYNGNIFFEQKTRRHC